MYPSNQQQLCGELRVLQALGNGNISGCEADVTLVCTDADKNSADRDEQFMGGIYADGYINVSDCVVNI